MIPRLPLQRSARGDRRSGQSLPRRARGRRPVARGVGLRSRACGVAIGQRLAWQHRHRGARFTLQPHVAAVTGAPRAWLLRTGVRMSRCQTATETRPRAPSACCGIARPRACRERARDRRGARARAATRRPRPLTQSSAAARLACRGRNAAPRRITFRLSAGQTLHVTPRAQRSYALACARTRSRCCAPSRAQRHVSCMAIGHSSYRLRLCSTRQPRLMRAFS